MNKKSIVLVVVLFLLIIAGMFMYAGLKNQELKETSNTPPPSEAPTVALYPEITRIDAKHFFIDGTHTLVGEIQFPTPCDLLESTAVVAESMPEQVTIDFTVINNAENCAQMITAQRFQVSIDASENAVFSARFMGRAVELNLVPAADGETPEEFELYIKG